MMGVQERAQGKLFYAGIDLEKRVRPDHALRRIAEVVDFDFVYGEVADRYGANGNVSVPPPVILKLMVLLVFYNVRSERELMATVPERLDWLWFLGFDLDTPVPDHSVLSKARRRLGRGVFQGFFERIVLQCAEAGLVDGSKIFVDASVAAADASNASVVDMKSLKGQLEGHYWELERRLADGDGDAVDDGRRPVNRYGKDPRKTGAGMASAPSTAAKIERLRRIFFPCPHPTGCAPVRPMLQTYRLNL